MKILFLTILISFWAFTAKVKAQELRPARLSIWLDGGLGSGFLSNKNKGSQNPMNMNSSLSLIIDHWYASFQINQEIDFSLGYFNNPENEAPYIRENSFLFGYAFESLHNKYIIATGISRADGIYYYADPNKENSAISYTGIPLKLSYIYYKLPVLGIGVDVIGNINKEYSSIYFLASLKLGRFARQPESGKNILE
jgi:hypothetical protein